MNSAQAAGDNPSQMVRPRRKSDSGQAAVETALVLPLLTFLLLGIIQLTMMQHAKLMTEYAAYQAARAGSVWNGNNERMQDAAIFALLPTLGRTDNVAQVGIRWLLAQVYQTGIRNALMVGGVGGVIPDTVNGSMLLGMVRVDTVSPSFWNGVSSIWKIKEFQWRELDFDDVETYPQDPSKLAQFAQKILKFFDVTIPDKDEEDLRKATLLSIRLRYYYQLRVPFANWIVFQCWYASMQGQKLYGEITRASTDVADKTMTNRRGNLDKLAVASKGWSHERGYPSALPLEMTVLWMLAQGSIPLVSDLAGPRYFIPLTATHSMRMQSAFHYKWLMHINPGWSW